MMKVIINNSEMELQQNSSLIDALLKAGFDSNNSQFAIAINCEFIPKSLYQNTVLKSGDVIEVLTAMQGG